VTTTTTTTTTTCQRRTTPAGECRRAKRTAGKARKSDTNNGQLHASVHQRWKHVVAGAPAYTSATQHITRPIICTATLAGKLPQRLI